MPFEDFGTIGTDVSLDIYDPADGSFTTIPGLVNFSATPMTTDLEHHGLNGDDDFATIYKGWDLSFGYDRKDGRIDAYFAEREARYRSGRAMQTLTITETIRERDGSLSQYRFSRLELKQENAGSYDRENKVSGSIKGRGTRTKVS